MQRLTTILFVSTLIAGSAIAQCNTQPPVATPIGANGQKGTMFDVVNTTSAQLTVLSFDQAFLAAGTSDVEIYTKTGPWQGSENTAAAWTLVGTAPAMVHAARPTFDAIPVAVNINVPPGATQAFYITCTNAVGSQNVSYSTGVNQINAVIGTDGLLEVRGGVGKTYPFGSNFGLPTAGRPWNGRVNYCINGTPGTNSVLGQGCYQTGRSFYELFAGSTADLGGNTVTLTQNLLGGYTAVTTPGVSIVPPTGTGLALGDDVMSAAQALPFTFDYPGGSTTSIFVDSNGSLHLNVVGASNIGGTAASLLTSTAHHLCASMQDLLPDGATNVANVFVDTTTVPGQALFTWLNVPCFGAAAPAATSTFQIALIDNGTNDSVEFRYQSLVNNSTSNTGVAITGFSLGGSAINPGSSDLTAGPVTSSVDQNALRVVGQTRPVLNTSWNLEVSNIPATGVLGIDIIGISDPGLNDLSVIGMPGCGLRASLDSLNVYFPAGATHTYSFAIPNDPTLTGFQLFTTSALYTVPAPNSFGAITANGIGGTVGTL